MAQLAIWFRWEYDPAADEPSATSLLYPSTKPLRTIYTWNKPIRAGIYTPLDDGELLAANGGSPFTAAGELVGDWSEYVDVVESGILAWILCGTSVRTCKPKTATGGCGWVCG